MAPSRTRVYNWYISLVAAGCMVLYGYDASTFNAIAGSSNWDAWFGHIKDPSKSQLFAAINTSYTVGAIFSGWFLGGPLADWQGRRVGMAAGSVLVILATFMQTFAPKGMLGLFIAGRVIIGIGQGLALTAGPVYINELAPAHIRGHIMTFWQTFYSVGAFIAYWVRYSCSRQTKSLGEWDWRLVIIFQLLVPCLILVQLPFLPDTPRWYASRGNVSAARSALSKVRDHPDEIQAELNAILDAVDREKITSKPGYSALYREPTVRKRLLLALAINAGQQCTGQGSLNSYSTLVYQKVFEGSTVDLVNALNATCGIVFTLNALWTADRYGRKPLFLVGAAGMAVCMLIVATVGVATPFYTADKIRTDDKLGGTKAPPVAIAITFLLFLFSFFYKPSWGATTWIYTVEIFPLGVRAQATGMASQSQNIAGSIVQQFFPSILLKTGFACFYIYAVINILLMVFVWMLVPETKNVELEDMDELFGGEPAHRLREGDEVHLDDLGKNDLQGK